MTSKFKVGDVLESHDNRKRFVRVEIVDTSDDTYRMELISGFDAFDGLRNWYSFAYIHNRFHLLGSPTRKVRKPFFKRSTV